MSSIVTKAVRVQIKLGDVPLNVYQMPNGRYQLAGRNVTDAIDEDDKTLTRKMGVKSLKALPHAGLACPIKADTGESFIPVAIEDAAAYWGKMAEEGNKKAAAILVACTIESIERRADHALGILVDEQTRNARFELRTQRLLTRRKWTDTLKERSLELYGVEPSAEQYREWTVKANLALFERKHFKCDRDTMTEDEQGIIERFEFICCRQAKKRPGASPDEVLDFALQLF